MVNYYKTDENLRIIPCDQYERRCWIDMVNPTDDEVDDICELSGIPEEMIKAALDEEESARVDIDEGATMYIVDSPLMVDTEDGDAYTTIPVSIIYNNKCIVTVSLESNPVFANFSSNRSRITTLKPVEFILNFMLENVKRFSYSLKQIDKKSLRLQTELHKSMRNQELIELLGLQDSLVYFSTSLSANSTVYGRLSKVELVKSDPDYKDLYDDVVIETHQAVEMCSIYRDILKTTMDAFSSVISNNVNDVVKRLTIITILVSIPTLIAGLLGMNVDLPFGMNAKGDSVAWEFWIIIGISIILTVVVFIMLIKITDSVKIRTPKKVKKKRRRN